MPRSMASLDGRRALALALLAGGVEAILLQGKNWTTTNMRIPSFMKSRAELPEFPSYVHFPSQDLGGDDYSKSMAPVVHPKELARCEAFRPNLSLAVHSKVMAGQEVTFSITTDPSAADGEGSGVLFYSRLVGPSIEQVTIERTGRSEYQGRFFVQDPGEYTLEVVMEYCGVKGVFPILMADSHEERTFVGLPVTTDHRVTVLPAKGGEEELPFCSSMSELSRGRWRLDTVDDDGRIRADKPCWDAVSCEVQFKSARWSWVPRACRLPHLSRFSEEVLTDCQHRAKPCRTPEQEAREAGVAPKILAAGFLAATPSPSTSLFREMAGFEVVFEYSMLLAPKGGGRVHCDDVLADKFLQEVREAGNGATCFFDKPRTTLTVIFAEPGKMKIHQMANISAKYGGGGTFIMHPTVWNPNEWLDQRAGPNNCNNDLKRIRITIAGDSVSEKQAGRTYDFLHGYNARRSEPSKQKERPLPGWNVNLVNLGTGGSACGLRDPGVKELLIKELRAKPPTILELNAGLHDYQCVMKKGNGHFDRKEYEQNVRDVLRAVDEAMPDGHKVWRTAAAAWMKWGNYKASFRGEQHDIIPQQWKKDGLDDYGWKIASARPQAFWTAWQAVIMLNDIQKKVLREFPNWEVLDAFPMNAARPDSSNGLVVFRQDLKPSQTIDWKRGRFVHPGNEIMNALAGITFASTMEKICPATMKKYFMEEQQDELWHHVGPLTEIEY